MKQPEIDYWIACMLETYDNVSDLNVTVDKPLQVETSGVLTPVRVKPEVAQITPFQAEVFALNVIGFPTGWGKRPGSGSMSFPRKPISQRY